MGARPVELELVFHGARAMPLLFTGTRPDGRRVGRGGV